MKEFKTNDQSLSSDNGNGYTAIPNKILDAIISLDISGQELRAVLFVIRKTYGFHKEYDYISLSQFVDALGTTADRACRVVRNLERKKILISDQSKKGRIKRYKLNENCESWILSKKSIDKKVNCQKSQSELTKKSTTIDFFVNRSCQKSQVTKKNITKENITKENNTKESAFQNEMHVFCDSFSFSSKEGRNSSKEGENISLTREKHSYSESFERFWQVYPIRRNKYQAYMIWRDLDLDHLEDEIIEKVKLLKEKDRRWLAGYIPLPTTFLAYRRWEDQPETDHEERKPIRVTQAFCTKQSCSQDPFECEEYSNNKVMCPKLQEGFSLICAAVNKEITKEEAKARLKALF